MSIFNEIKVKNSNFARVFSIVSSKFAIEVQRMGSKWELSTMKTKWEHFVLRFGGKLSNFIKTLIKLKQSSKFSYFFQFFQSIS